MTARSGLGPVEVAVLSAYAEVGALPGRSRVKNYRVLDQAARATSVGRRYVWDVLRDMARPRRSLVPLVDFQGNAEEMGMAPMVEASYNEGRLTVVGALALAAENREIPASPIGLINGDFYQGGERPSFAPHGVLTVLSQLAGGVVMSDDEVVDLVGAPVFSTGCAVGGDVAGLLAGGRVELLLAPVVEADPGRPGNIQLTRFPPEVPAERVAAALKSHVRRHGQRSASEWVERDLSPHRVLPLIEAMNVTSGQTGELVIATVADPADREWVMDWLRTRPYHREGVAMMPAVADLGQPMPALLRDWVGDHHHPDLASGLDRLAEAITATTHEAAREREDERRAQDLILRRRRAPSAHQFPLELLQAIIDLDAVADDARVALTYRPGNLAGTIGAQLVEVREPDGPGLGHPRRTGTVAADGFDVAWTKTQTPEGITNGVRLAGTFAGARVELDALLHPSPAGPFGHGSVHGSLADQLLNVTIQAVQGGLGTGRGVKITGTLGEVAVELFADLSPERRLGAVIRGTVNNNPVHIDITRRRESDPLTIVGAYQGPTSLLVMLLGILTAFWR